jgi:NAD+ synthase (glutamine-hydrolysing)
VRLALCQMNATVGDLAGNAQRIRAGIEAARTAGAELVLFPELALTGYPPEDLLLREHFLDDARAALLELARCAQGILAVVGFPERVADTERTGAATAQEAGELVEEAGELVEAPATPQVHNAAAVLADGAVRSIHRKVHLPNYGVFDERRYFKAGHAGTVIEVGGHTVGVTVCEDLWLPGPPASEEVAEGAKLILNISASPYHAGKGLERERLFARRAREHGAHIAFCGLVGGQDELLFDGHSFLLDPAGETIARAAQFQEELLVCDVNLDAEPDGNLDAGPDGNLDAGPDGNLDAGPDGNLDAGPASAELPKRPLRSPIVPLEAEVYAALCLGLRDYVQKNGFARVVLGLSGGIDSALVACLAADALGSERVSATIMPSPYSSTATQSDARALAAALGVRAHELPIRAVMDAYTETLREELAGGGDGLANLTEENLQARIRGNLLMALSNRFGWLVLTTGNKSEMSVGYTTLYGDLAGGFAVIKDVPKTLVYRLCEWRNSPAGAAEPKMAVAAAEGSLTAAGAARVGGVRHSDHRAAPIPPSIIARAPSAELRKDQRDEDSLPPYELLDRILQGYIELDRSREQLIAAGLPAAEVDRTIRLVDLAEYKRRQAPPGIKITTRAFGRDRRMPITNRYRCPPTP